MPSHPSRTPKKPSPSTSVRGAVPRTIRRSFALPARLIEQVSEAAPPEFGGNLNGAVRHALEDFVKRRKREEFGREMERMAADPQIQKISAEIDEEFRVTELDGLPDDPTW
jgi:hypothetical protein